MRVLLLLPALVVALCAPVAHAQVRVASPPIDEAPAANPPGPNEPEGQGPSPKQAPVAATDWLAYGRDGQLTNGSPQPAITSESAPDLHELWGAALDGPIIASPLTADGIVYASTEAGSVYAVNASDGSVVWTQSFGKIKSASCGKWGISSTGAIDLARGLLYVLNADGVLRALDLATGAVAWTLPVTDRPKAEYVWGGLRLAGDLLYVPVASYCDAPDLDGRFADGRLLAVDVGAPAIASTFDSVPGVDDMGGPWGWGGVSIEADGSALYAGFGNSRVYDESCDCFMDNAGYGDSMVRLSPDLRPLDSNRPASVPTTNDSDFGAAPLLFDLPDCGAFAAANNKDGSLYVWQRDRLSAGPLFELGIGTTSGAPFVGEPSWSADRQTLYDASTNVIVGGVDTGDGVTALSFDANCAVHQEWQTVTGHGTQPPPLVLGDVLFAAGGSDGWSALAADTGAVLWHFDTSSPTLAPPIAADGRIFAGTLAGRLYAFGT